MNINMEPQELVEDKESKNFKGRAEERGSELVGKVVDKIEKGTYIAVGAVALKGAEALHIAFENISRGAKWLKDGFEEIKIRTGLRVEILKEKARMREVKAFANSEVRSKERELSRENLSANLENTWNTYVTGTKNFFEGIQQSINEARAESAGKRAQRLLEIQAKFTEKVGENKENIDKNKKKCNEVIEQNSVEIGVLHSDLDKIREGREILLVIANWNVLMSEDALKSRKEAKKVDGGSIEN